MNTTKVNGVVLNDKISKNLSILQDNYAHALASGLDDAIGFLLEDSSSSNSEPKALINVLCTLHNARTEFLNLIPEEEGGAQ